MAEIFLGRVQGVEGFERPVVIKKVRRRFSRDDRFHAMLIREAKITATLSHPNIVQILDLGQNDKDEYFIVMEYVDGRDLRSCMDRARMKQRPLGLEAMVYVAMEVCAALDYAHRKTDKEGRALNLIHRDVSPANVLISTSGEVKLADFGIARYGRDVSAVGSLKGKLGYMSPEQARAEPVDQRSDIFSVGAVLFEAALGKRPFSAKTDLDLLQQVQAAEITAPSSVDPEVAGELERILLKAMAPAPRDRYSGAEELAAALRRFQFNRSTARVGPEQLASLLRGLFGPGAATPPGKRSAARFMVNTITGVHRASVSGLKNPLFGEALTSIGKPSEALLGEMMKDLKTDELGLEEYDPLELSGTDPDLSPDVSKDKPPIDNLATDPMGFTGGLDLMKIVTNILPPETIDDLAQQTRGRSRGPLDDVATVAPEEAELAAIARSMPELAIRNAPGDAADGRGLEEPPTPPLDDEASDAGLEPFDEVSTPAMGTPGLVARLAGKGSGQIVMDDTSDLPTSDLPTSDLPTSDLQQSEVLEVDDVAVELAVPDKGAAAVDDWPTPALVDAPMAASTPALPVLTDAEDAEADDAPTPASLASTAAPVASTAAPLASTAAPLPPAPPAPQAASTSEAAVEPTADPVLLPPVASYIAPRRRRSWGVWLVVALAGLLLGGGGATVMLLRPFDLQLAASPPLSSDSEALRRVAPAAAGEVADPAPGKVADSAPKTRSPAGPAPKQPETKLAGHTTANDKPAVSKPAVSKPAVSKPAVKLPDPPPPRSPVKVAKAPPSPSPDTEPGGSKTRLPRTRPPRTRPPGTSDDDRPRRTDAGSSESRPPARPPKRGKRGQVVIKSDPWAYIHVDGKRSKRTTSARPFSLPPGKHTIELVNPKLGLRKSLEIEVQEGELVRRFVRLE